MKTENKKIVQQILMAISSNDRVKMVETVIEFAGDEYEDKDSYIELATKSDSQLITTLIGIANYYINEEEEEEESIGNARKLLKENGYQTDNLWTIHDVKDNFPEATNDQALDILHKALTNEETMSQINFAINMIAEDMGLKFKRH